MSWNISYKIIWYINFQVPDSVPNHTLEIFIFIKSTTELKILVYCNVMLHQWVRSMTLNPLKCQAPMYHHIVQDQNPLLHHCETLRAYKNKLIINWLDVIPNHPHLPHILSSCVTSWKAVGSIPNGVIRFFIDLILLAALWLGGRLTP
jgi:hypothetical protein